MSQNQNREWEKLKEDYHNIKVPENGLENMKKAMEQARNKKAAQRKVILFKRAGACVAAALVVAVLLPNVNANIAMAMEKIPVIGGIVRVITFGRYDFEDEKHEAQVEIPKVEVTDAKQTVDNLNKDIEDYINPLVEEFKSGLEEDYNKTLTVSYEVVTDSDTWFTLRIDVLEIQASGYMYSKYYHINKETGERMQLKDLFRDDSDFITVISENIKDQMRQQMASDESKMYFIDSTDMPEMDFDKIKEDQNFYFNENGEIVIAFDEYEVAPGSMGTLQFTIPRSVTDGLLK